MNLSHLQYFRELAQVQHYTKAAHNLFISQPTLSHSIASLEDELGVKLFEKNGRTVKLTDDGALFAQYVERSLDALEDGIGELEKRKGRLSGTVRLGAIHSVRSAFLPEAVLAYRRTHGNLVELKIDQGSKKELLDYLHTGENDLAITSEVKADGFVFTPLFRQRLVVIVHEGHPFASRSSISVSELADMPVYTYREDIIVGTEVSEFLESHGLDLAKMNLNRDSDDEVILGGIVSRAPVVGLALDSSGLYPFRNLKLIPLEEPEAQAIHPIGVLRLAGKRFNPATNDFIEFLFGFAHNFYHYDDPENANLTSPVVCC